MNQNNSNISKVKMGVHKKFAKLRAALQMREKLLLRQLEVVASTNQHMAECGAENKFLPRSEFRENDIKIQFENEDDLLGAIRTFGRFQLGSMLLALKQEDYIAPSCDHETMYKNIKCDDNRLDLLPQHKNVPECIVVDFSKDKSLIEHNTKYMNDSIVNITLEEAKELIKEARIKNETALPPLNLEELDDELESSIAEVVSTLNRDTNTKNEMFDVRDKSTSRNEKIGHSKPRIKINNCSGTINLRNISSVTINCNKDIYGHNEDMKTKSNLPDLKSSSSTNNGAIAPCEVDCTLDFSTPSSAESFSNQTSSSSSRSQSKKQKKMFVNTVNTDSDTICREVSCDFYNRLLNEIKRNLDQQKPSYEVDRHSRSKKAITNQTEGSTLLKNTSKVPQLVLKNFENLNIILKNCTQDEPERPVHIKHWLSEIIKDTDLEPMQNTDILEHSKINDE